MTRKFRYKVLVIEDDHPLSYMLARKLEYLGYTPSVFKDGNAGLEAALSGEYILGIVDIGLPSMSGLQIVKRLRQQEVRMPIIIITSELENQRELESFKTGANIFHAKPVDFDLLSAQIDSLLQQVGFRPKLSLGDLELDLHSHTFIQAGKKVPLTKREFELIRIMMANPATVFSREDIMRLTFPKVRDAQSNSVDTMISRVRRKLKPYKGIPVIETLHGVGFRLSKAYEA